MCWGTKWKSMFHLPLSSLLFFPGRVSAYPYTLGLSLSQARSRQTPAVSCLCTILPWVGVRAKALVGMLASYRGPTSAPPDCRVSTPNHWVISLASSF